MSIEEHDDRGLLDAVLADGRPLLILTGLCLVLAGGFALFLSAMGQFLPHDVQFLGMAPEVLCSLNQCRIVHFMIHDRVAFGGSLIAVGLLYMWLAAFPLREREAWAWWAFVLTGITGFGSFLAYLGHGYLDTWHGVATLFLLPCFVAGLYRSYGSLREPKRLGVLFKRHDWAPWNSRCGIGRLCLLATAGGMITGGLTIMFVGMTSVFVPQDLSFMGMDTAHLKTINPRLIPLIAHDRAGFGGGIATCGVAVFACVWCARPSRSLWQILGCAGIAGFSTAIGIHVLVGYMDALHLAPAVAGALLFTTGELLCVKLMLKVSGSSPGATVQSAV